VTVIERPLVRPSLDGPAVGLAGQFALLAVLAGAVGLDRAAWVVGAAFGVVTGTLLGVAMRRAGALTLGPANSVTLARATLVGGVAALIADALTGHPRVTAMVILAAVALLLDGVDGQVARRTGTTSALGARFDMEVDAVLILMLSAYVAGSLGPWVLAIGALRYLFVAASWALPWLRVPLPHRYSRKVVCATQGVVLVVAMAAFLPTGWSAVAVAGALAALVWSFGRDVMLLAATRTSRTDGRVFTGTAR
jgi:phosphatidylglycerophosphate synthase